MRFSCEKAILNDAISVCIHAVASKSSIAALEGLLITAESTVSMCGYNFKTAIQKSFDADVSETGVAVINARVLSDIVRKLPDDVIELSVDEKLMATVKCGASEFNIMATPAEEYPDLPAVDSNAGVKIHNLSLIHICHAPAEKLGGQVGVSRPLVDMGWMGREHQIGQTGTAVSPRLLIAFGISGAIQHLAGMGGAQTVIAVNTDPDAPIFQAADYKVVGDAAEVLQSLLAAL